MPDYNLTLTLRIQKNRVSISVRPKNLIFIYQFFVDLYQLLSFIARPEILVPLL